jgi:hypothetical protein
MTRGRGAWLTVGLAGVLAFGGVLPSARAAAPDDMRDTRLAESMQDDGQRRYDQADYFGAARTWGRILEILTENEVNRQERDNALLITLDAYSRPYYENYSGQSIRRPPPDVVQGLVDGVAVFDRYVVAYERAYGKGSSISPAADEAGRQIKAYLEEAGGAPTTADEKPKTETKPVVVGPICDPRIDNCGKYQYRNGVPLIVIGSITMAAGLGCTALIIVGGVRNNNAASENPPRTDRTARGMIIGGSIATGVLLVAGATMLGVGIRRRVRTFALTPTVGPRFAGLGVTGKF